jgi:hypothetical protein
MVSAISDRPQVQLSNKAVLVAPIDTRFRVVGHAEWIGSHSLRGDVSALLSYGALHQ